MPTMRHLAYSNSESTKMVTINITIASPYLTPEKYASITGDPIRTVNKRIQIGELPADSLVLEADKVKGSVKYINMIKLAEMAASSSFVHPRLRP